MEKSGIVVAVENNIVKIRIDRESACGGNCVSCKGCPGNAVVISLPNEGKFEIGQIVRLEMKTTRFLWQSFLGYGLTAALIIVGAVVGYKAAHNEGSSIIGAALGLLVGLIVLRLFFKGNKENVTIKS